MHSALQETSQVTLPAWGSEGDGCLHDYVPNVRHLLLDKVQNWKEFVVDVHVVDLLVNSGYKTLHIT